MKHLTINLTNAQAAYLQSQLPQRLSLQLVQDSTKRIRSAKKLDDSFTNDFDLNSKKYQSRQDKIVHSYPSKKSIEESPSDSKKEVKACKKKEQKQKQMQNERIERIMTTFLLKLKMHKSSWPFRMPVDPVSQDVPNYFEVIRQPMDLKTIDRKIKSHAYKSQKEFDRDVRLIIANSYDFNSSDTVYYTLTKEFQTYYEQLRSQYRKDPDNFGQNADKVKKDTFQLEQINLQVETTPRKKRQYQQKRSSQKKAQKNQNQLHSQTLPSKQKYIMNNLPSKERQNILHKIQNLSQNGIRNMMKLFNTQNQKDEWQQLQFDLAQLSEDKFIKLQQYLKQDHK